MTNQFSRVVARIKLSFRPAHEKRHERLLKRAKRALRASH
jgi:hypothetical protein